MTSWAGSLPAVLAGLLLTCVQQEFEVSLRLGSQLHDKSSPQWGSATAIYNTWPSNNPDYVYVPYDLGDVVRVVNEAYAKKMSLRIKAGGCDFLGLSTCSGECIVVNLHNMSKIEVDRTTMTANVSAGATNSAVYRALFDERLAAVTGTCQPVGFAGLALGGGLGILMRMHGVAAENVVAIQIVLYDGTVLLVDARSNSDLFWALRGGGAGSFGVVVSFRIRVFNVSTSKFQLRTYVNNANATEGGMPDPAPQAPFFLAWTGWIASLPNGVYSQYAHNLNGKAAMTVFWNGTGSEIEESVAALQHSCPTCSIERIGTYTPPGFNCRDSDGSSSDLTWQETVECLWSCGHSKLGFPGAHSRFALAPIDDDLTNTAIAKVHMWMDAFASLPNSGCNALDGGWADVLVDSMGGAMPSFDGQSSFAHNNALFHMQFNVFFDPAKTFANNTAHCKAWLEAVYSAAGAAGVSSQAYRNYPAVDLENWQHEYFGTNYPQLQQVKAKYDPDNFFSYALSIELPSEPHRSHGENDGHRPYHREALNIGLTIGALALVIGISWIFIWRRRRAAPASKAGTASNDIEMT